MIETHRDPGDRWPSARRSEQL